MASFRRTLSPYQDRQYQNEAVQYVEPLLNSHRLGKPSENSMLSTVLGVNVRRLLAAFLPGKSPRKTWRRWLTRCLLCFLLGSLLGMTQFGYENDLQAHDFSFEIKPPYVNAQLEDRPDEVLVRQNDLMLQNPYLEVGEKNSSLGSTHREDLEYMPVKQLIVITPTYNRALQAYFLNRIGQLLRLVKPPLLWIVVEMNAASMETAEILRKSGVIYQHLVCKKNMTNVKDRGVHQRNTALEHIELHRLDGIVYFADDDNIYSTELFENLRQISRFGTWPIAMLASFKNKAILEGPVCNGSQVIGWHTNEKSKRLRRFHVDMSGFAFNSTILWDPKIRRWPTRNPIRQLDTVKEGFQETTFIEQLVEDESQMEALPPTCLMILNWHLHLDAQDLNYPKGWLLQKNLEAVLPIE